MLVGVYLSALGTTCLFAAILIGAGTLVSYRLDAGSALEKTALRLAFGMAVLPMLLIFLRELFGVRPSCWVALLVGAAGLCLGAVGAWGRRGLGDTDHLSGRRMTVLVLLSLAIFFACLRGALRFPTFEGRDPWGHALGIAYVAETGSLRQPFADWPILQYVDAYPPLYDVLMSIPVGFAGHVNAPLKAANALVVGSATLVFYVLAFTLFRHRGRAMAATLIFAVLPGNLTRHVWGHSVAVVLLFAGLVAALRIRESWRWLVPGALCFAGALLSAPSQGLVNGALLLGTAAVSLSTSREWCVRTVALGSLALALSLLWFGPVLARYGTDPRALASAMQAPELRRSGLTVTATAAPSPFSGEARRYGLDDFFFFRPYRFVLRLTGAKEINDVVPEGLGAAVSALCLAFVFGAILRLRGGGEGLTQRLILLAWLLLSLAGLLAPWLGRAFFAWRFWLVVCPFASLAAADALFRLAERSASSRWAKASLAAIVIVAVTDAILAVTSDASGPGPWSYVRLNLPFLLVPLAGAAGIAVERNLLPRGKAGAAVLVALAAHVLVAAPARLRTLTHFAPPKGFFDEAELEGYVRALGVTEPGARVYPLSGGDRCSFLIAMDRRTRPWDAEEHLFARTHSRPEQPLSTSALVEWLREHSYAYVILDPSYRASSSALFDRRASELSREPGVARVLRVADPAGGPSKFLVFRIAMAGSS